MSILAFRPNKITFATGEYNNSNGAFFHFLFIKTSRSQDSSISTALVYRRLPLFLAQITGNFGRVRSGICRTHHYETLASAALSRSDSGGLYFRFYFSNQ